MFRTFTDTNFAPDSLQNTQDDAGYRNRPRIPTRDHLEWTKFGVLLIHLGCGAVLYGCIDHTNIQRHPIETKVKLLISIAVKLALIFPILCFPSFCVPVFLFFVCVFWFCFRVAQSLCFIHNYTIDAEIKCQGNITALFRK